MIISGMPTDTNSAVELYDENDNKIGYYVYLGKTGHIRNKKSGYEFSVGYGTQRIFITDDLNEFEYKIVTPKKHIGFEKDGAPFGSMEDYLQNYNDLARYSDDYEIPRNLDYEFKLRRRLTEYQEATKVYSEEMISYEPLTIEVLGSTAQTGSNFIETAIRTGKLSFPHSTGLFSVLTGMIAHDEVEKIKASKPEYVKRITNSTHSNIEFLKVDGEYLFTSSKVSYTWVKDSGARQVVSTLEDAKKIEYNVRKIVREILLLKMEPKLLNEIPNTTLYDFHNKLSTIYNYMMKVTPTKSTQGALTVARQDIVKLMQLVKEENEK